MVKAYYNEFDKQKAAFLREFIRAGLIAPGDVDERSITDVAADDLDGYSQCHFFAGLGIWSYALRQAGVPDSARVWTGSPPCQPFSEIGLQQGFADGRHLWPEMRRLVAQRRPEIIFGEQSQRAIGFGWLDLVQVDLEGEGYAFAAVGLPACSIGAPHMRDRLWFVGHADGARLEGHAWDGYHAARRAQSARPAAAPGRVNGFWSDAEWRDCRDGKQRPIKPGISPLAYVDPTIVPFLHAAGDAITAELARVFIEESISAMGAN
jgi:DNA (cytosine-5)-methyltransferase 1